MSEVRGDDALGGVPFNVSNPAFASGAGSTRVEPVLEEPELEVPDTEQTEVEDGLDELAQAEQDEIDGEAEDMQPALEDLTKAELQEGLRDRELPVSGNKPELIERLGEAEAADAAAADETTTDVPDGEV